MGSRNPQLPVSGHPTELQVPWANLGAAPVIVEMDRIFVLATPNTEFQSQGTETEVSSLKLELTSSAL